MLISVDISHRILRIFLIRNLSLTAYCCSQLKQCVEAYLFRLKLSKSKHLGGFRNKLRCGTTASADHGSTVVHQHLHITCKIRRGHAVNAFPRSSIWGIPALGLAMTGMETFSLILRITDTSWSGPTEQLMPTASAPAASRDMAASMAFPPLKILPSASTVTVQMIGSSQTLCRRLQQPVSPRY